MLSGERDGFVYDKRRNFEGWRTLRLLKNLITFKDIDSTKPIINFNNPSENIVGGKTKLDDDKNYYNNDDDRRSHKKS